MSTRKYEASRGEPENFDFDGTLRDRKLTPKSARAMLQTMVEHVPEISTRGSVTVSFGYRKHVMRRGSFCEYTVRNRFTYAIVKTHRNIVLHVNADGNTEKTMLHELAHACAPKYVGHGAQFSEWCLKLEAIWLNLLTQPSN